MMLIMIVVSSDVIMRYALHLPIVCALALRRSAQEIETSVRDRPHAETIRHP